MERLNPQVISNQDQSKAQEVIIVFLVIVLGFIDLLRGPRSIIINLISYITAQIILNGIVILLLIYVLWKLRKIESYLVSAN